MYDPSDPRSALVKAASQPGSSPLSDAEYGLFYRDEPGEDDANGRSWYCRGQNFVIAYTDAKPGASFERADQGDEYRVLLQDRDTPVVVSAGAQEERSDGYALIVMPPGPSRVVLPKGGRMVRLFSARSPDLAAKCANAASYAAQHPTIPPFEPWPAPPSGYRIRVYTLDVPIEPGQFGRIWRCTTLMVNIPNVQTKPRDLTKVSPHSHDDFEQCSLVLAGAYEHHMRWPWGVDATAWHEDVHAGCALPRSPSSPPR